MSLHIECVKGRKKLFVSEDIEYGTYHWWIEVAGEVLAEGICSELFLKKDPRVSYKTFTTDEWIEYIDE